MELSKIAADVAAKDEGVWETYHTDPVDGDIAVLIASSDNDAFRKALRADVRKQRKGFRSDSVLSDAANQKRDVSLVANHICKDWKGIVINGEVINYTPEAGIKIFGDPKYRHFFDWVWEVASDIANYIAQVREESAGNSESA